MAQLIKKIKFTGEIYLKTGLHVGGTNSSMNIGGPDKFVVRNPISNKPYIPGSSIKGKMRSLLELAEGTISRNNGPTDKTSDKAGKLFGTVGHDQQPSRLIVRDAELLTPLEEFNNSDLPYTETKTEVAIDRITARANPRTFERVPAGARFGLEMILNVFDSDDEKRLIDSLYQSINLLEDDYLGGHGSRGYGYIEIKGLKPHAMDKSHYENFRK